jgi:hypothetical protein
MNRTQQSVQGTFDNGNRSTSSGCLRTSSGVQCNCSHSTFRHTCASHKYIVCGSIHDTGKSRNDTQMNRSGQDKLKHNNSDCIGAPSVHMDCGIWLASYDSTVTVTDFYIPLCSSGSHKGICSN